MAIMEIIDFIIPTYNRYIPLKSMLASLCAQTKNNWRGTVVIDDINNDKIIEIIKSFDNPNLRYILTGKRYNDWGHTPREIGKQASDADYIIMTGDDNYYIPTLIDNINTAIEKDKGDLIYWDMVHSHYHYSYFKCKPRFNNIDMGAFAFNAKMGKQIKLSTKYAADGIFIEDFKRTFPEANIVKIDKVLFVHN
jgi:glycosyltransferase involved in cell wall biosynthesis